MTAAKIKFIFDGDALSDVDVITSVRGSLTVCKGDTLFRSYKGDGVSLVGCVSADDSQCAHISDFLLCAVEVGGYVNADFSQVFQGIVSTNHDDRFSSVSDIKRVLRSDVDNYAEVVNERVRLNLSTL